MVSEKKPYYSIFQVKKHHEKIIWIKRLEESEKIEIFVIKFCKLQLIQIKSVKFSYSFSLTLILLFSKINIFHFNISLARRFPKIPNLLFSFEYLKKIILQFKVNKSVYIGSSLIYNMSAKHELSLELSSRTRCDTRTKLATRVRHE